MQCPNHLMTRRDLGTMALPLLITGVSGVAGFCAMNYFARRSPGQVVGIVPGLTQHRLPTNIVCQNAEHAEGMSALFRDYRFRSVLNTVGNCALKSCELDPQMACKVNVVSARVIADLARSHDCRLVHLSSDLVFSGVRGGNHVETDRVDPVSVYGKTMVQAERLIADAVPSAVILRMSLPMGPSVNRHAGAIDWIESRFRNGRPATLYFDEVRSCTYCDDLNPVFERFLAGNESGIYHLGGPEPRTLFEIAQVVNRVGGYAPDLLHGCLRVLAGPVPPRAGDVSMSSAKLIQLLGCNPFRPWPADSSLTPIDRHWHRRRAAGEQGSRQQIIDKLYHPTANSERIYCTATT